jgi:hypothetical protein
VLPSELAICQNGVALDQPLWSPVSRAAADHAAWAIADQLATDV